MAILHVTAWFDRPQAGCHKLNGLPPWPEYYAKKERLGPRQVIGASFQQTKDRAACSVMWNKQ